MEHQLHNVRPEGSLSPIPYSGINKGFLYGWVITLGLGALSFGYSIGSFAQDAKTFLCLYYSTSRNDKVVLNDTDYDLNIMSGLASSLVQIGGTIGSITAGAFAKYGKKNCIHITNLITVIGCCLIVASGPYGQSEEYPVDGTDKLPMLYVGRFIYGLGAGCFTVFVNSFISEISPNELKGPMGIAF
jgi:MFS family permease